jgi:hypothetical protein
VGLSTERYFKAGSVEALRAKLQEFIGKSFTPTEKSSQVELMARRYNWDDIAEKTFQVYKSVVK